MLKLTDPNLLRTRAYVAGEWIAASGGGTVAVTNPATGEQLGTVPDCGAGETRSGHRGGRRSAAGLARPHRRRSARRCCASSTTCCSPTRKTWRAS